jgi:hypothetical protein
MRRMCASRLAFAPGVVRIPMPIVFALSRVAG